MAPEDTNTHIYTSTNIYTVNEGEIWFDFRDVLSTCLMKLVIISVFVIYTVPFYDNGPLLIELKYILGHITKVQNAIIYLAVMDQRVKRDVPYLESIERTILGYTGQNQCSFSPSAS